MSRSRGQDVKVSGSEYYKPAPSKATGSRKAQDEKTSKSQNALENQPSSAMASAGRAIVWEAVDSITDRFACGHVHSLTLASV